MKTFFIVLLGLGLLIFGFTLSVINAFGQIDYDYEIHDFKFDLYSVLNQLATQKQLTIDTFIKISLINPTWLSLALKNVDLELYYNNVLFVKTMKEGDASIAIIKHATSSFDRRINVFVTKGTYPILGKYQRKEAIPLTYKFSGTLFGITLSKKGDYIYTPS